jgi:hypothetical protein
VKDLTPALQELNTNWKAESVLNQGAEKEEGRKPCFRPLPSWNE